MREAVGGFAAVRPAEPIDTAIDAGDGCAAAAARGGSRAERGPALLRGVASAVLGVPATRVRVRSARCPDCGGEHGAPSATAGIRRAWLSLAHAGPGSGAVASVNGSVGVDAVLADADPAPLVRMLPGTSRSDLLRQWTRVEAVLKADGRGLRVDPDRIRFLPSSQDARGPAPRGAAELDGTSYRLTELVLDGMLVTIAAARAGAG
ncbi:MAG: hypothetical protein HY996_07065 [Micrococcales bacterium]|nr:hypothetical protein [Micrococcales bacterium]